MVKRLLIKLHWILSSQFGFDPLRLLRSLRGLPAFFGDWWRFRREYSGPLSLMPCLHDRYEEGGITKSEYFLQDLLVARWIREEQPEKHVDVGSRLDGFVAHVASFREIEVFDVRPVTTSIPGVVFKQADLMQAIPVTTEGGYCDSLSCLHALEHFGLGRYSDPIDPNGHKKGLANMAALLKPGGTLYLSTPIGRERVEFNAHRVFDPRTISKLAEANGLTIKSMTVISNSGTVKEVEVDDNTLSNFAGDHYNLGIFTFRRLTKKEVKASQHG